MTLKWIQPQSRFMMKTLFKRNYDTLTNAGQNNVDKLVLLTDIVVVIGLFWWL